MRLHGPTREPMTRRAVLAALVVCQLASGVGFVAPGRSGKDTSRPFPCMDRPCGCLTYEQCWAGDCCCFTLREKIAWAEANRIVPPAPAAGKSCCRPTTKTADRPLCPPAEVESGGPIATWVVGLSALRCKGHPLAGWWFATPALPPVDPITWTFEWVAAGVVPVADSFADLLPSRPADPPPRG